MLDLSSKIKEIMIHVFPELSGLCKWQNSVYQSWFCNDCRSSASFTHITTITLNSVFYYSLSLESNLSIVKQQQRKANILKCLWNLWNMTEINEKWWAQPHTEHRLKGSKEDRGSLLPWYLKTELIRHQVTELHAEVLSGATYQITTQGGMD